MPNRLNTILAILIFAFVSQSNGYAQSPIDQYKYIIIPKQFGFLKKENQYRVNSTTKYLFDQNGYTTLMQGENYPADLRKNPCLGAKVDILDESSAFMTKLFVVLIDCHDEEVFRTVMGKSREKSYDKTYIYALNNAFVSFETLSYSYNPALNEQEAEAAVVATTPQPIPSETKTPSEPADSDPDPSTNNSNAGTTTAAAGVGVAAATVATKESSSEASLSEASLLEASASEASSAIEETATEEVSTAAAAAPLEEENPVSAATSYGNENVAFLLIQQGDKLVAYVSDNRNPTYKKGEMIGTLVKTSLPNVFRASWKHMDKDIDLTTAYFDDQGNLKIDVERGDKIEVLTFNRE